jgi:hypothetical protein
MARGHALPSDDYLNCLASNGVNINSPAPNFWLSLGETTVQALRNGYTTQYAVTALNNMGVRADVAQTVVACSMQVMGTR